MIGSIRIGESEQRRIFWAGDSTVQTNVADTWPQTGIGQMFPLLCSEGTAVYNFAKNGTSTKSFCDLGLWDKLVRQLRPGDFVFLQFGHNDNKPESPERYTDPWGTYTAHLQAMLNDARAKGALPVLITPLARQKYDDTGTLRNTHGEYPAAMRALAAAQGVPCVDLTKDSMHLLEQLGRAEAGQLFMQFEAGRYAHYPNGMQDTTHLQAAGAMAFATLIAQGLSALGAPYAELIAPTNLQEQE